MNIESLSEGIVEAHDRLVAEAVEAERERNAKILDLARIEASTHGDYSSATALLTARDMILLPTPQPEPQPPAPEPMTVAKVMTIFRTAFGLNLDGIADDVEVHLVALVQEQARRDAAICSGMAGTVARLDCHDAILKAAGLQ